MGEGQADSHDIYNFDKIGYSWYIQGMIKPVDNFKKCTIENCNNLGEFDKEVNGRVYRRKICSTHRVRTGRKTSGRYAYAREKFKSEKCHSCEYCGWVGPCDVHRPVSHEFGGKYEIGNMRSACPNCHRLISMKLKIDAFLGGPKESEPTYPCGHKRDVYFYCPKCVD